MRGFISRSGYCCNGQRSRSRVPKSGCSLGGSVRAVVVREPGPPENLEPAELARPTAGAGRVVVRVSAAGVNPVDATNRADPTWAGIEPPYVVGYEFAGWIEEVGLGIPQFARGDRVWGMCPVRGNRLGTYADYVELEASWVGPRPAALDAVEAAAIPLAGSTALQLLDRLALQSGETVLVLGASGGVGRLFVQLARMQGIRVAASSSRTRHALLRDLGVEIVIDREGNDVVAAAVRQLGGALDAVADCAGHGLLAASLVGIREGGSAGSIVELSGDFEEAIDRNLRLHGVLVRPERETLDRLRDAVEHGALRPVVDAVVEPDGIVEAHRGLETGHGAGKVVLRMADVDAFA
jgi:NADPH:quinone reductase